MKQTTAKVIDLQEYRQSKQTMLGELNELQEQDKAQDNNPHYRNITMPYQCQQAFIIPDYYCKLWNKFWAIGCTILVVIGLL